MREHEAELLTNEGFTYAVTITKQRKIDLPPGVYVTNCINCHATCHFPCAIANDALKSDCAAMDWSGATCRVCPGGCSWNRHFNNPYRFELYEEDEERTQDDLKQRYFKAVEGKTEVEAMISTTEEYLAQVDELVKGMIRQVQRSLKRLDEIALKPNPLSEVEYIDLLISSEQQEKKPGWSQRVQYLQHARQQAQLAAGIRTVEDPEREVAERKTRWMTIRNWWYKGTSYFT